MGISLLLFGCCCCSALDERGIRPGVRRSVFSSAYMSPVASGKNVPHPTAPAISRPWRQLHKRKPFLFRQGRQGAVAAAPTCVRRSAVPSSCPGTPPFFVSSPLPCTACSSTTTTVAHAQSEHRPSLLGTRYLYLKSRSAIVRTELSHAQSNTDIAVYMRILPTAARRRTPASPLLNELMLCALTSSDTRQLSQGTK